VVYLQLASEPLAKKIPILCVARLVLPRESPPPPPPRGGAKQPAPPQKKTHPPRAPPGVAPGTPPPPPPRGGAKQADAATLRLSRGVDRCSPLCFGWLQSTLLEVTCRRRSRVGSIGPWICLCCPARWWIGWRGCLKAQRCSVPPIIVLDLRLLVDSHPRTLSEWHVAVFFDSTTSTPISLPRTHHPLSPFPRYASSPCWGHYVPSLWDTPPCSQRRARF